MVVIDTLFRALAGGNENACEDMGTVVANADRIRAATGACVLMIHQCGKDAVRGMRGHSSLKAATDSEIEVACGADKVSIAPRHPQAGHGDRGAVRLAAGPGRDGHQSVR